MEIIFQGNQATFFIVRELITDNSYDDHDDDHSDGQCLIA